MMKNNHISHSGDLSSQGVRVHSFVQYRKLSQKSKELMPVFIDIDLEKQTGLELSLAIPIFSWGKDPVPNFSWSEKQFQQIVSVYEKYAKAAKETNYGTVVLGADEDGLLHRLLSPRFYQQLSSASRLEIVVGLFKAIQKWIPHVGVALVIEELCPGGLDATDGIEIALALQKAGASFILANAGTHDFPALKNRKPTKIKNEENNLPVNQEVNLASSLWLVGRISIPIFAQSDRVFVDDIIVIAKKCGLAGIVTMSEPI
jgi:hypothetical protein